MQSTWYRLPEEEVQRDNGQGTRGGRGRGRGRARGRGRGRGRGNTRQVPEAPGAHRDTATPYHVAAMGQHQPMQAGYIPHPYHPTHYNPSGMEEMPPHWQYVASNVIHPSHRNFIPISNPTMSGYQRFPSRHTAHTLHGKYGSSSQHESFQQSMSMGNTHPAHTGHVQHGSYAQLSGFHYHAFSHPARNMNYTPNQHKTAPPLASKRNTPKDQKPQAGRVPVVKTEVSHELTITRISKENILARPQASECPVESSRAHKVIAQQNDFPMTANVVPKHSIESETPKTLAETAAFLNNPQLILQQTKNVSSNSDIQPTHTICAALTQTAELQKQSDLNEIIAFNLPQGHQTQAGGLSDHKDRYGTRLAHEKVHDFSSRPSTLKSKDSATSILLSDLRKYSELHVTIADEPPPAHQAAVARAETVPKYPELYTPPLAHQAPVSQIPSHPQSARINATHSLSPPPAHQASIPQTLHHVHSSQSDELRAVCRHPNANVVSDRTFHLPISETSASEKHGSSKKSKATTNTQLVPRQSKRKSKTAMPEDVLRATHAYYTPHQMLGEAQIVYQPSTETFASEQVVYQPHIDMFTKEQIVYQPRRNVLAKTQVVYQPHTDFIATAEAVYQSDMVSARQTVIQPQAGTMKSAQATYNTQENIMAMKQSMHNPQTDLITTTKKLYRQHADILAPRQSSSRPRAEILKTTQSLYRAQENILTERETVYQSSTGRKHSVYGREGAARSGTNKGAPILRNMLSHEQEHVESRQAESNMATLQQLLLANYVNELQNPSTSIATSNQTLRQTRKRKIHPTELDAETRSQERAAIQSLATHEPGPAQVQTPSPNAQSIIALNWTLQAMATGWQLWNAAQQERK